MRERERREEERPRPGGTNSDAPDAQSEKLRAEAERLLEAGNTAIQRALSTNSVEFLRASRQRGGQ